MKISRSLLFFTYLISCFAFSEENVGVGKQLEGAITCEGEPISTIYELVEKGSDFGKGYAVSGFGQALDYKAVVILKEPILIGKAKSSSVVADLFGSYYEFRGIVYGEFSGDYKKVIQQLNLHPVSDPKSEMNIGKFERKVSTSVFGKPNGNCPKTIGLTPLENGKFMLGCGWCNGG